MTSTTAREHRGRPRKKKFRTYGYVRVSTEEQANEGISLDAQRQKIEAYCQLHDLDLFEIITDRGESGKDLERPGFRRLRALVERGEVEAVLVYKLDRISRRTRDLLFLVEDLFKDRVRFLSITEQVDTESAIGKFFLTLMGALAQMERDLISERTSHALAVKKAGGERLGTTPLGYTTAPDGALVANPAELLVVDRIRKWRRRGQSYGWIARKLNAEAVPTKRGGRWYPSTVRYVAKNTRYRD